MAGLSIAAVSYYIVRLFGYVAKGLKEGDALPSMVTPEIAAGLSVPFVIVGVWWMLHHARKSWSAEERTRPANDASLARIPDGSSKKALPRHLGNSRILD